MIRAGVGQSQEKVTRCAVEKAAAQALSRAGISRADFAIIFFTADHAAQSSDWVTGLSETVGTDCVVGSSGAGVLTGEGEIEGGPGVVVCVVASDTLMARPFIFEPLRDNETNLGISFGDFLAPLLLGGPSGVMISNIVVSLFGAAYNWPLGAAVSFCMLGLVVGLLWLSERLEKRSAYS